jgi:cobalt/nickel transport system permease protein
MIPGSIAAASIAAVAINLQLGAFGVVLETQLSGIAGFSFSTFLFLMQPIHLAIGMAEGIITAAVLCFVYNMRPEIMESTYSGTAIQSGVPMRNVLITLAVITLATGGILALFASSYPDGLEWSLEKAGMAGYYLKNAEESSIGTSIAGIAGSLLTFLLAGITALAISAIKRKPRYIAAA